MATQDTEVGYTSLPGRPVEEDEDEEEVEDDQFPKLTMRVEGGQSSLSSVFTLCNSAIGAGVLSMPFAFRCAGLIGGTILCVVVGAAMGFTLFVLVRFSEYYRAHTYQGLVRRAFGKKTALATATILALYLFGGCIAYLVIIGDTFTSLALIYFGEGWWSDRRNVIIGIGTLVVLPLCYPKRLGRLAGFSAVAVIGFLYTCAAVLVQGLEVFWGRKHPMRHVDLFRAEASFLNALPMMVFGYQCHTNVVTIYQELAPEPRFTVGSSARPRVAVVQESGPPRRVTSRRGGQPNSPKLLGMRSIISLAILLIMAGYIAVGAAGYLAYPTDVASNVLNSFPADDVVMQIARAMIGIVVVTHYPVNHHPARTAIEDLLRFATGLPPFKRPWRYLQATIFYALSIITAVSVKDLGDVIHLIGGTAAGLLTFGIPGMLLINSIIDIRVWVKTGDRERAQALQAELIAKRGDDPHAMPRYGNSWMIGMACVTFCLIVFALTIYTAVVPLQL